MAIRLGRQKILSSLVAGWFILDEAVRHRVHGGSEVPRELPHTVRTGQPGAERWRGKPFFDRLAEEPEKAARSGGGGYGSRCGPPNRYRTGTRHPPPDPYAGPLEKPSPPANERAGSPSSPGACRGNSGVQDAP